MIADVTSGNMIADVTNANIAPDVTSGNTVTIAEYRFDSTTAGLLAGSRPHSAFPVRARC